MLRLHRKVKWIILALWVLSTLTGAVTSVAVLSHISWAAFFYAVAVFDRELKQEEEKQTISER